MTWQLPPIQGMAVRDGSHVKTISLLMTEEVILPGETTTIWTNDLDVLERSLSKHFGVLATGLSMKDDNTLMEMASLCQIKDCSDADSLLQENRDDDMTKESNILLTLECVGRVKLQNIIQDYPHLEFEFSLLEEDECCDDVLEKCQLVAQNIETFIRILSHSKICEEEMVLDHDDSDLLARYRKAFQSALGILHQGDVDSKNEEMMRSLSATSWAAFTAVKDRKLKEYRLRALDYESLFDRLKLAQYMLREKELRLQGASLKSSSRSYNEVNNVQKDVEGFQ